MACSKHLPQSESYLPQSDKITKATILVLDATNTLSFAAAVDPLRAANRHAGREIFRWQFATPTSQDVQLTSGLIVPAAPIARVDRCDLFVIVAGFRLKAQTTPALRASLRRLANVAQNTAGIDGGPWVMARAGLLDGQSATTHWEDIDSLSSDFPQVHVVNSRYQISGNRLTSAGATPAIDMMLALIRRDHGARLASQIAASFILDHSPSPAAPQLRNPDPQRHNRTTARAHALMEDAMDEPLPIALIAKQLGIGARALQLQFRAALNTTAQQHYLSLRLLEARRQVTTTTQPLHDIALATGFTSQSSFARAYVKAFGINARAQRSL